MHREPLSKDKCQYCKQYWTIFERTKNSSEKKIADTNLGIIWSLEEESVKKILLKIIKTTDISGSEEGQYVEVLHTPQPKGEITPLNSRHIIVLLLTSPTKWQ